MSLFSRMPNCIAMLNETLSDQERADRAARRNVIMVVQRAIEDATNRVRTDDDKHTLSYALVRQRATKSSSGNISCHATLEDVSETECRRLVSMIKRLIRSAGITADIQLKQNGSDHKLRVVVDRGHVAVRGGSSEVQRKQDAILNGDTVTEDVSKPITSQGSTKHEIPRQGEEDDESDEDGDTQLKSRRKPFDRRKKPEEDDESIFERFSFGSPATPSRLDTERVAGRLEGKTRRVPRAKMLWKRKDENGLFTERWMYLAQSIDDIVTIKRNILSETDIPVNKTVSPSGEQGFVMEQFGDVVFITISGLKS